MWQLRHAKSEWYISDLFLPLSDLTVICQLENVMFSINSSGCIIFETGDLLLYCVSTQTMCGYKMCCMSFQPSSWFIPSSLEGRLGFTHTGGDSPLPINGTHMHVIGLMFWWLDRPKLCVRNNQHDELWDDLSHWFLLAVTFSLNAFETWCKYL